ncbi:MAG: undecaprenyldiphospho-muramoylpentapeptide beta-N-acetylglucosaminyltransferase [Sphingomonadaceae bacterium]|nr:undecaprenyldiphospho-muramoylpentapeptide beta-N-acetylglucosaminyltransferase [Sphingomonadaceae bacterium]
MTRPILLCAGGTGGHMIPAHALSQELQRRGRRVVLLSDARGLTLPGLFEGVDKHELPAASPGRGGVLSWPRTALTIMRGRARAAELVRRLRPAACAGFGGYPSLPGLWAATGARIPSIIHEQNAVLGRVNRRFGGRVQRIATSYPTVRHMRPEWALKVRLTGNPVRPEIAALPPPPASARTILVIGGSQGASIFSTIVPRALVSLSESGPLRVIQQARTAELPAIIDLYREAGIPAEVSPFFTDMAGALSRANLVIARAGASTIAELTCAGRPSILVPLPSSMDDHQTANARALADAGGAILISQREFTPERLSATIAELTPERLGAMAAAARSLRLPDAASTLADLIEEISL